MLLAPSTLSCEVGNVFPTRKPIVPLPWCISSIQGLSGKTGPDVATSYVTTVTVVPLEPWHSAHALRTDSIYNPKCITCPYKPCPQGQVTSPSRTPAVSHTFRLSKGLCESCPGPGRAEQRPARGVCILEDCACQPGDLRHLLETL